MKFIFIDTFAIDQLTKETYDALSFYLWQEKLHIVVTPMLLVEYFSPQLQAGDRTERAVQLLLEHPFVVANQNTVMQAEEQAYPDLLPALPIALSSEQFLDPLPDQDKVILLRQMLHHGLPETGFDLKNWAANHQAVKNDWADSVQLIIDTARETGKLGDKSAFVESLDLRLCAGLLETVENLEKSENHNQNFFTNINKLHRINELHDTNLMPGIHLSSLMTWYDYVIANKKIHASDWADIFHAILYPYCDVVIADASRVDCIRRVQREDGLYKNVRFYDKKAFLKII